MNDIDLQIQQCTNDINKLKDSLKSLKEQKAKPPEKRYNCGACFTDGTYDFMLIRIRVPEIKHEINQFPMTLLCLNHPFRGDCWVSRYIIGSAIDGITLSEVRSIYNEYPLNSVRLVPTEMIITKKEQQ